MTKSEPIIELEDEEFDDETSDKQLDMFANLKASNIMSPTESAP